MTRTASSTLARRTVGALCIGLLAVAIGCSGGGGVNAADFAAKGNELCQKLATEDAAGRAALGANPTPADLTTYIQATYVPEANETYRAIGALPKPKDAAADIDALVADALAEVSLIQNDPVAGGNKVNQASIVSRFQAVGLTACGSGFAKTVDKQSFIDEASSICENLRKQVESASKDNPQLTGPSSTKEQRDSFVLNDIVPVYRETVDKLEGLGYPPADAALLSGILTDSRKYVDQLVSDPEQFFQQSVFTQDIAARWHQYGVTACG